MAKNAKNRMQKYEFGGMVGKQDRYGKLTGAPRNVSSSIRQRNTQGLGRITPEEGADIKDQIAAMVEMERQQRKVEHGQWMQDQGGSPPPQPDPNIGPGNDPQYGNNPIGGPPLPSGPRTGAPRSVPRRSLRDLLGYKKGGKVTKKNRRK